MPILTMVGLAAAGMTLLGAVAQDQTLGGAETSQAAGQTPSRQDGTKPPRSGQTLLENAIRTLESRRSVSAKIRHSIDLFDRRPVGSGIYLEERSERGLRIRMEVRIQLAGGPSSLLHVCDGRFLWTYQKIGEKESLRRVDILRVEEALERSGRIGSIGDMGWWPGLGGLPKLLRGLHATFDFHSVEDARLGGRLPVWRLRGAWKPEKLAKLLPDQNEKQENKDRSKILENLPPHLPDHVLVYLGKADLFPYRVEYRRRDPKGQQGKEKPEGRAIVTMELREVDLNASIHPTHFLYNPGDLEFSDQTPEFLQSLGLTP